MPFRNASPEATYTFCATLGRLVSPEACDSELSTSKLPLATICWYGTPSVQSLPKSSTALISGLMAAGLVARVLACFWLPFAATGVEIQPRAKMSKEGLLRGNRPVGRSTRTMCCYSTPSSVPSPTLLVLARPGRST